MSNTISNSDDTIDSRDVIERIEELASEREALIDTLAEANEALEDFDPEQGGGDEAELHQAVHHAKEALDAWGGQEELSALSALADDAEGCSDDWEHGATLIRDSYFRTYAEELAEDIGAINSEASWPNNCIDWERAARELQQDYTSVEFSGVTYWVR